MRNKWENVKDYCRKHSHPHHLSSWFLGVSVQSGSPQNRSEGNKKPNPLDPHTGHRWVWSAAMLLAYASKHRCGSTHTCFILATHVHDYRAHSSKREWTRSSCELDSNLAVVKVTTQGDVTDQLRPVHQICKEPAKGEEGFQSIKRHTTNTNQQHMWTWMTHSIS